MGREPAFGATFNVTDSAPAPHRVWLGRFAETLGWSGRLEARDDAAFPGGDAMAALDFRADLATSGAKLRAALDFTPPVALDAALARTAAQNA